MQNHFNVFIYATQSNTSIVDLFLLSQFLDFATSRTLVQGFRERFISCRPFPPLIWDVLTTIADYVVTTYFFSFKKGKTKNIVI